MTARSDLPGGPNLPAVSMPAPRSTQSIASRSGLLMLLVLPVVADASQAAASAAAPSQSPTAQAPPSRKGTSETDLPLPEVTVQAKRNLIEPQVRQFVNGSLYLENDEAPARWISPICPAVAGLSHGEAEFMLARLSQIARAAGVPLDRERCTPANLYVVATAKPEVFLKWAKVHWRLFEGTPLSVINDFIATPRIVRVWYNSEEVPSDTERRSTNSPPGMAPTFIGHESSRLTRNDIWSLKSAVVVVDRTQLKGVKIGQLTDYVSMYAFSRLKTQVHFGDVPTILGLFEGASSDGESAQKPPGLTPWDEAFLESLYHTDPKLVLQRTMMVTRMVNHIVPGVSAGAPTR